MKDLTVNLVRQGLCAKKSGCHAAFDTGTGVIAGPKVMIDAIMQELKTSTPTVALRFWPSVYITFVYIYIYVCMYVVVQNPSDGFIDLHRLVCLSVLAALRVDLFRLK